MFVGQELHDFVSLTGDQCRAAALGYNQTIFVEKCHSHSVNAKYFTTRYSSSMLLMIYVVQAASLTLKLLCLMITAAVVQVSLPLSGIVSSSLVG